MSHNTWCIVCSYDNDVCRYIYSLEGKSTQTDIVLPVYRALTL